MRRGRKGDLKIGEVSDGKGRGIVKEENDRVGISEGKGIQVLGNRAKLRGMT